MEQNKALRVFAEEIRVETLKELGAEVTWTSGLTTITSRRGNNGSRSTTATAT